MRASAWRRVALAPLLALLVSACSAAPQAPVPTALTAELLMVVIDDPRSERSRRQLAGPGYSARLAYADDPALRRRTQAIARDYELNVVSEWPLNSINVHCFVITPPSAEILRRLNQDGRVRWVQPFNEFETRTEVQPLPATDDAAAITASNVARFAAMHPGRGRGARVAVVDTGVDQSHRDLTRSDLKLHNFVEDGRDREGEAHGTAVVGLIAARPDSARGVEGLAHNARVDVLRACWELPSGGGKCNTLTLALALDAAIALKPDVLNLSLTGGYDRVLQRLIERLTDGGTLIVAAYDERREPAARFPSPVKGVVYAYGDSAQPSPMTVAASDASPHAVVAAPREAYTLVPMNQYGLVTGHSIAAPQVASMAACLMTQYPNMPRMDLLTRLSDWMKPAG